MPAEPAEAGTRPGLSATVQAGGRLAVAPWLVRALRGFGAFWWDFLISDTPELLVGVLVTVGVVVLVARGASANTAAVVAFPVLVVVVLALSVNRARPRPPRK